MESESELELESVGSSDEEVTFALLRFPAVNNVKALCSYSSPTGKTTTITTFYSLNTLTTLL
jgi:hypothetical protein